MAKRKENHLVGECFGVMIVSNVFYQIYCLNNTTTESYENSSTPSSEGSDEPEMKKRRSSTEESSEVKPSINPGTMLVKDLKHELKLRGLKTTGLKPELAARLESALMAEIAQNKYVFRLFILSQFICVFHYIQNIVE